MATSQQLQSAPGPTCVSTKDDAATPFSRNTIELTQQEYIELKSAANYWRSMHLRLKEKYDRLREDCRCEQKDRTIRKLSEQLEEVPALLSLVDQLQRMVFGRRTEKSRVRCKPQVGAGNDSEDASKKTRGQRKGSKGPGRTPRQELPSEEEFRDVADDEKVCGDCGKAYAKLPFTQDSEIIEVVQQAIRSKIRRAQYRKTCQCRNSPGIKAAEPAARVIPKSPYGVSVLKLILTRKYLHSQPSNQLLEELKHMGLPISAGTVSGLLKKMPAYFERLIEMFRQQQLSESPIHYDETSWKVFENVPGKVGRRWYLWLSRSSSVVYCQIAPTRSADIPIAHLRGLNESVKQVFVVCDRYSAYTRLAREFEAVVLAICWAHVRRDFIEAGNVKGRLTEWAEEWVRAIGGLYALNARRMECWQADGSLSQQSQEFALHHRALREAMQQMVEKRDTQLSSDSLGEKQCKVLRSMQRFWDGLSVFVNHPQVPMDNNAAERSMRTAVVGRKCYYGSGSLWSAELAQMMFSVFQTLELSGLNPYTWLHEYLTACANAGGQAPRDLSEFVPWQMNEQQREKMRGAMRCQWQFDGMGGPRGPPIDG